MGCWEQFASCLLRPTSSGKWRLMRRHVQCASDSARKPIRYGAAASFTGDNCFLLPFYPLIPPIFRASPLLNMLSLLLLELKDTRVSLRPLLAES